MLKNKILFEQNKSENNALSKLKLKDSLNGLIFILHLW